MKNLQNLKVTELKEIAKELKVKNWWLLKKSDLIKAIEWTQGVTHKLTLEEEIKILPEEEEHITVVDITEEKETETETETETGDNLITLKELILEAGIKGTKARRILRNSDIERPFKRWEWDKEEHKSIIKQVRDLLK